MGELEGKSALVTGGSRGIGRAVCLELARRGARVVVNYQAQGAAAQAVVATIREAGGEALAVQADVADAEAANRLVKAAAEALGGLDILVNNAGITRDGLL
ncbi:MAG: SDR family NAD(P)-dependent oxidoreductase, partial [Gemmataceae bacterium]|nr:SDR family NAD(P)-dependent oxidoreductase [Gemmataceae bacterium]